MNQKPANLVKPEMKPDSIIIHWFRRDLRLEDNKSLHHALNSGKSVMPIFIFDKTILDKLDQKDDARVTFIHRQLGEMKVSLEAKGSTLYVFHGNPRDIFKQLIKDFTLSEVHTNRDYEPYARQRDEEIKGLLQHHGISFYTHKDHVIFEPDEVLKDDGHAYTVFTPYSRKWKSLLAPEHLKTHTMDFTSLVKSPSVMMPTLENMGFTQSKIDFPAAEIDDEIIRNYHMTRDIPSLRGTSRLSIHLRFGTLSIRKLMATAFALNAKWLDELIWREFYQMILFHFPHTVDHAFKPAYDRITWINNVQQFEAWCKGITGYPIVDAGMRELNETGFMHNRVRMIVASFLVKHLLIDWRWGERYFAEKLLDFELASNVGGWQWAAGSGCDAAPYFRIFNPALQTAKFDPEFKYIRKWVPELNELSYPSPIVDHAMARDRCLSVFKKALAG